MNRIEIFVRQARRNFRRKIFEVNFKRNSDFVSFGTNVFSYELSLFSLTLLHWGLAFGRQGGQDVGFITWQQRLARFAT